MGMVRVPPNRSKDFSCKRAQQLGLQIERNVAHFIEKQSPAMRHFKAADLLSQARR